MLKQIKWEAVVNGEVVEVTWAHTERGAKEKLVHKMTIRGNTNYAAWINANKPVRKVEDGD